MLAHMHGTINSPQGTAGTGSPPCGSLAELPRGGRGRCTPAQQGRRQGVQNPDSRKHVAGSTARNVVGGRSDAAMTVLDMDRSDMDEVINALDGSSSTRVSVLNEGQLGFALGKPGMVLYGTELHPELHQKAAVLMETLCKSHTLTDGNKRASVMAAEYLANINGATLVVPLKTARLAVDCAMDADDRMSEEIAAWFKAHIARDEMELAVMLEEVVEERDVVTALLDQRRYDDAEQIVDVVTPESFCNPRSMALPLNPDQFE